MPQPNKFDKTSTLNFIKHATPLVRYESLVLPPNRLYVLETPNAFFPSITFNSGSILEISNVNAPGIPFRLEIGDLIFKPNGPAALMRFFNLDYAGLEGFDGDPGERGNNGTRTGIRIVPATKGGPGENGGNGKTIVSRGTLYLSVQNLIIIPDTQLTRAIFSIDARGVPGGIGGNGGAGGKGGDGALGRNGAHECDWLECWCSRSVLAGSPGANGGPGGLPGNGGNGGNGGKIIFAGPENVFNQLAAVTDIDRGIGGVGGRGGAGGARGIGAPAYGGGGGHCGRGVAAKPHGNPGADRRKTKGTIGSEGEAGSISLVNVLPTFESAIDTLIQELPDN